MADLRFSSPVPIRVHANVRKTIWRADEAAEVLLYDWPKSAIDDPICKAAMKACHDAIAGKGAVQNARTVFEAAAREVGILDEA